MNNKFDIPPQTRTIHFKFKNEIRKLKLKLPKLRFWCKSDCWHCVSLNDDEVECYVPLPNIFYDNSICLSNEGFVSIESKEVFLDTFYNTVFTGDAITSVANYIDFSKTKYSAIDFLEIADDCYKEEIIFDFLCKWQNNEKFNLIPIGKGVYDKK